MSSRPILRAGRRSLWVLVVLLMWGAAAGCGDQEVLPFVPYEVPTDIISPPSEAMIPEWAGRPHYSAGGCAVERLDDDGEAWKADRSGPSRVSWRSADDESERTVIFETMRWSDQSQFDRAERLISRSMGLPCFTTGNEKLTYTEPITLEGLPDGALAVRWLEDDDQITVVMFDADAQIAMVMGWRERHGDDYDVPTDKLVDVANQAWSEFLANNPPLD